MKKLLTKFIGATAALAMVIGVGFVVANNNKQIQPVFATDNDISISENTTGTSYAGTNFDISEGGAKASGYYKLGSSTLTSKNSYNINALKTISYSITTRKFGGPSADEAVVNLSLINGSTTVATASYSPTDTDLKSYTGTLTVTGDTSSVKFVIKGNGTSGGGKGVGISSVSFTATSAGGGDTPTLSTVSLSGSMTKTAYTTAENWDPSGLVVTGTFSDFSNEDLTSSATFSYYSNSTMTSAAATPNDLGAGNGKTLYIKATVAGKSNASGYSQTVNISAITYSVTYQANGATSGSVPTDANAYNNGAAVTVLGNPGSLAKTGYVWSGWNTKADGTGTSYAAGATFNISSATTLYARWVANYASSALVDITALYLNLPEYASAYTSETIVHADDGMEYVIAPNGSGNKAYAITSDGNKSFDNSALSKIFMGKSGAYLYNKDPFPRSIEKVEVYASSGCSQSVSVAVDLGTTVRNSPYSSSPTNLNTQNKVYTLKDNQGSNNYTFFRLQVANAYNANIQIRITFYNPTTSVTVSPASVTLNPTDTQQLTTTILPVDSTDEIVYSSDDPTVATVSEAGLITAVKKGSATITATSGSCSDTCEVTVENPAVAFITPTKDSTSGYTGQKETISFTYGNLSNTVAVISDDASIVSISNLTLIDATNGTVKFNFDGAGSTSVKFKDGETGAVLSSVSVSVIQTTVSLNKNETSIYPGEGETLTATANVGSVNWTSNNAKVAVADGVISVADDAVANSTATITATSTVDDSVSATCVVTVLEETRWNTGFTTTLVEDIDLPVSGDTSDKYYVVAKITEITNATYGNANAIDENDTIFSIYGMYSYNGQMRYDQMPSDIKPVVNDVVVLYGVFRNNEGPQMRNARVVQRNGNVEFKPNVKLDLSTDTTSSASTTLLTWQVPGEFSMQVAKGTASTDTNNYYPGTAGKDYKYTKFYKNSVFTFTPAQGVTVSRVSFAVTSGENATAFASSAFTNATAVATGNVVVVTPTNGSQAFTATVGNTCGFTAVNMFYDQTIKQYFENEVSTKATLSYTGYTDNGDDTFSYTNLAMRFGGYIDKDSWDILDASLDIQGYGILFAKNDDLNGSTIMEAYDVARDNGNNTIDQALALLSTFDITNYANTSTRHNPALKLTPTLVGNEYRWALYMPIAYEDVLDEYSAVAYIRVNDDIVFLGETSTYAAEIADQLIESGAYPENALGGSLAYLAGR